jgi:hypothetical protein
VTCGKEVWVAWKETQDAETSIRAIRSRDGGLTWSAPRALSRTTGNSDHPFLLARATDAFLSWFTAEEGYRLVRIE